jgi:hypothetical protein
MTQLMNLGIFGVLAGFFLEKEAALWRNLPMMRKRYFASSKGMRALAAMLELKKRGFI